MPKVELVGIFKHIKGWKETAKSTEKKMNEWGDKLKDWTVRIQEFSKNKNNNESEFSGFSKKHMKNKILTINYLPDPVIDPEKEANAIMQEFEDLEEQGKI